MKALRWNATNFITAVYLSLVALSSHALAEEVLPVYLVKPGDILIVTVWKEEDLKSEALVRPDGKFSFPLVGDIQAAGQSVADIQQELVKKIEPYIPEAAAAVMMKSIDGNKAFVVGKVNRPGPILMTSETNVMQALSMAGGASPFAGLKDIVILRGQGATQTSISFNYDEVEHGKSLEQNITLKAGDVVVVP